MPNPKFFFIFILVHISFLCRGQEVKITPIPYPLDQFLTNIVGMCQDEEGFIWLADNYNGLIKYDGFSKKYYKTDPNNSNSLFSNRLETLTAGKRGIVWIGSAQNGLDRFDPATETFIHYQHDTKGSSTLTDDQISALLEDPAGTLWVGTGKGLDTLNQKTGEFVPIEGNSAAGILLKNAGVRVIYGDRTGTIWIGAGNAFGPHNDPSAGLYQFERKSGLITHYRHDPKDRQSLIGNNVRAIFEDSQGNFYVGTDGDGLHIMDRQQGTFRRMLNDLNNPNALSRPPVNPKAIYALDHITFINEDFHGCIWIGTYGGGINRYNPKLKTMEFFGTSGTGSHHLEKNDFWTMLKTKDGLLWIAGWEPQTENQVLFQVSTLQNRFDHTTTGPRVITFAQGSDNGIWIGTEKGLFGKNQDEGTAGFFSFVKSTIGSKYITDIGFDEQENLWITTLGGIFFFDRKAMSATFLGPNEKEKESLSSFAAISVLPLKDETVWIGTNNGLDILDIKSGKIKRHKHKLDDLRTLSGNSISDLFQDSKGNIWVATNKGLDLFQPDSGDFKRVLSSAGASILGIFEDSKHRIWVNSHRSGLFLLDPKTEKFIPFFDASGLITDRMLVKGMVEDELRFIWLNTDIGFIKMEPETRDAVLFGQSWKQTTENNFNSFRTFISKSGEIFSGDASGYIHFSPQDLTDQYLAQPIPYFTRFFLSNSELIPGTNKILPQKLHQTKYIKLPYNQNTISIEFGNIDFVTSESEKNILFKLDNYDQNWKNGNTLVADYYNLPTGEYVFQVKSANRFGNIGQRSLAITVMPPWFTQWWAWLSYAVLLFLMLYWVYGFLLRRKLSQAEVIRLKDLDLVKTRIYTNLTHEFRTPLTVISGIADHILSQPSMENLKDGLPMIKRNSAQLLRLINQMLDLSKLESGRLSAKMIHDDILSYLKYLTESFHSFADSKDIRLHLLPGIEELHMDFDPEKIQAIFSNLVGNAVKFTPPGGNIYIKIEKNTSKELGEFLEIKVKDTGKGISSEHLPYIFDRFYQVDNSSTRSDEGTGIGLALTKELVQLMSGTIEANSQLGKGSEFTLRLPIKNEAPKGNASEFVLDSILNVKDLVEASGFGTEEDYDESLPMALLIEDNEDVLSYLELCLQGKYRIQKARNGLQGIQLAIEMIPDIIVSDVMMPEKDGYEVVERLKKDERTSHIPIILLTAKADLESRLEGLERGADAYLSKPFEKKELEVRLRKLIELRQKMTARYAAIIPEDKPETPAEIQEDTFLKKLRSIVDANLESEEFGIGELCKELAVSRTQLHRKLKALTNKSTSQVIRTIRMQEAKKLLLNPDLNISEIGYAVGYGNPSHFTQEFTKEFGEAPSFFRKG
jgi:signal transduction histidine kinase/ligand-binding sensor domain-containing protein/DNA-binding response OmpR family regulator